ncbi:MAG TPA: 1-(5-phosphoribosyl)-5-[(5-phosphoribosylamino)methylideneamino] imidazole-4-carboxamide isomerase [Candidatus Nanopelagicaceae bacterium]|nr:1-(5-phosphoribosyl)-5-[(5-phosphoribosylamino)methylideneamino] imidazole-4-carboxamide isomerase [Candidatus Nanopelagicaceae bacterium]
MLVIPAIDLLAGGSVRLVQGRYDRVLSYGTDPVELAERYRALGAPWLHVIDLEGARAGRWVNLVRISEIAAAAGVPVQAGGGARDRQGVEAALSHGVQRVIISTAALADRHLLEALVRDFEDAIVVSLDVRRGRLLARGWLAETGQELVEAARRMVDCGVRRLVHTDTLRDGTMAGVDLVGLGQLLPLGAAVMVAGGIADYRDLERLRDSGAEAAIVGRALSEGTLDLARALATAA